MAKRWTLVAVGLFVVIATGCQNSNRNMSVSVPPPSFTGPTVLAKPGPAPLALVPPGMDASSSGPSAWVPRVAPRPWRWIVIHHSASEAGSMAVFDREHKAKGWDGVGYHFVIGNGTNSGDGQIEVTPRWPIQKWGAHAKTLDNRYNEYGIGICLVGNFDSEHPSQRQIQSLTRLVSYLMRTYHISPENVVGHRDTKPTDCPGRFVNVAAVRRMATQSIAAAGDASDQAAARPATGELLTDVSEH